MLLGHNPYLYKLPQASPCHSDSSSKFQSQEKARGEMHTDRRVLDTSTLARGEATSECTAPCCIW